MKTTQLTHGLVRFIILFSLFFLITGCDDDDSCSTFLKCQDGTVWEGAIDLFTYFKINNSQNNPIEIYLPEGDCYYYSPISETIFEIMENSKNTLKIKIIDDSDDSIETITLSISNDVITAQEAYIEDGYEDIDTGTFTKSTIDLSSITICNDD